LLWYDNQSVKQKIHSLLVQAQHEVPVIQVPDFDVHSLHLNITTATNAQFPISYPTAAQNATTCLNSSLLTVKVDVITAGTSPTVTIDD